MPPAILAIETSTPLGSVAVVRGDEVCFEKSFTSERSHNSQLFGPLRDALAAWGSSLRAVVVGTGPASYTGVRIGIAAAQGIALSRSAPVIGLPSVLGVITPPGTSRHFICGDARRGVFFVVKLSQDTLAGELATMDADAFRQRHAEHQDGALWSTFDTKAPLGLTGIRCVSPSATQLALRAAHLSDTALAERSHHILEPVYLSAPFITMPK